MQGDQRPRVLSLPGGSGSSSGREAIELAGHAGLVLDPWQCFVLEEALREKADGTWSAFEVALVVARQNGKGSVLEALELASLFLFGAQLVIHSAHEFKTAAEGFLRVRALVENSDDLRKQVKRVRTSHGEEAIELRNGARLRFLARTRGSARGFTGDLLILDEAYNLPDAAIAAMLPTLSARQNPQVWYTSSAVNQEEHQHGQVLARLRRRGMAALTGTPDPELCYFEWAPDFEGLNPEERKAARSERAAWAAANPGMGIRISESTIAREFRTMAPKTFEVERLTVGDWPVDDVAGWFVIPREAWEARGGAESRPEEPVAFAVECSWPDAASTAISVAGRVGDETVVQLVDMRPGTRWAVPELKRLTAAHKTCAVVIDPGSPAGGLVADAEAAGIELVKPTARETAAASVAFLNGVVGDQPTVRHFGQPELAWALSSVQKRPLGDGWTWARKGAADIAPLVSVSLAAWGYASRAHLFAQYDALNSVW